MPLPLSWKIGLGMNVTVLPYWLADVLHDVLVEQHAVGGADQRVVLQVDFGLATGGDFVVMALHVESAADHGHDHFACAGPDSDRWAVPGNILL